jgi:hypothetical protein
MIALLVPFAVVLAYGLAIRDMTRPFVPRAWGPSALADGTGGQLTIRSRVPPEYVAEYQDDVGAAWARWHRKREAYQRALHQCLPPTSAKELIRQIEDETEQGDTDER